MIDKLISTAIIIIVILLRAVVLDQYYMMLPDNIISHISYGIIWSPVVVVPVSMIVFIICGIKRHIKLLFIIKEYVIFVLAWALYGIFLAVVIIITLTIIYNSSQGPLGLFFDGPLSLSTGALVGTGLWIRKIIKHPVNQQSK